MIIVNWNMAWATARSRRAAVMRRRIDELAPQVIYLTEAYLDVVPEQGYVISASPLISFELLSR